MRARWHNRVARSSVTLPVAAVLTTLLWWLPQGGYSLPYLLGWAVCAVGMFFLIETAAQNVLIRVRSRMVSSLFLLLMAACGFMHELSAASLVQLSLLVSLYSLLRTCEKVRPELDTFHAYLALSLGSLLWPPLLWVALALLLAQSFFLRSLSSRSFGAVIIGLIVPYLFWIAILFLMGDIAIFVAHAREIMNPVYTLIGQVHHEMELANTFNVSAWASLQGERITSYTSHLFVNKKAELAALVLVVLTGATSSAFYFSNSYDDKIRVRMCHYTFLLLFGWLALWLLVQPWQFHWLFPLLLFVSVPSAAYWLTFSRSWLARPWFVVLIVMWLCVAFLTLTPTPVFEQLAASLNVSFL